MKEINFYFPLSIVYDGDYNYVGNMFAAKHYQEEILKAFDKILIKVTNSKWRVSLFSHCDYNYVYPYVCIDGIYKYCIPYNDDTKHLVGTEDEAPEYYRYWDD